MQKPSFETLDALVATPSAHMSSIVCAMLRHLRLRSTSEVYSSVEAANLLSSRPFHLIMLDAEFGPVDGVALTRALRSADGSPNRETPIIMMSSEPDLAGIRAARDAGVTEFLRKPFAVAHLEARLVSILTAPRSFIEAPVYAGPDRRRRRTRYEGTERRNRD